MSLTIKHPDAEQLARELAARTGETLTEAVIEALRERLQRETGRSRVRRMSEELGRIGKRCAALPGLHDRTPEEILGYNLDGI